METPTVPVVPMKTGTVEVVDKTAVPPILTVEPVEGAETAWTVEPTAKITGIVDVVVTRWASIVEPVEGDETAWTVEETAKLTGIVPVWLVGVCAWIVEPEPESVTEPIAIGIYHHSKAVMVLVKVEAI